MCGQLVYYYPFVASNGEASGDLGGNGEASGVYGANGEAARGPGARMTRPHPSEDPNNTERHNDLFNIFFNTTIGL
jgi:hypothetical protein